MCFYDCKLLDSRTMETLQESYASGKDKEQARKSVIKGAKLVETDKEDVFYYPSKKRKVIIHLYE